MKTYAHREMKLTSIMRYGYMHNICMFKTEDMELKKAETV